MKADELRETLEGASEIEAPADAAGFYRADPRKVARAIVSTLGITRDDLEWVLDMAAEAASGDREACAAVDRLERLTALLDLAEDTDEQ